MQDGLKKLGSTAILALTQLKLTEATNAELVEA